MNQQEVVFDINVELAESIADEGSVGFVLFDIDGTILRSNKTFKLNFDIQKTDNPKSIYQLLPNDGGSALHQLVVESSSKNEQTKSVLSVNCGNSDRIVEASIILHRVITCDQYFFITIKFRRKPSKKKQALNNMFLNISDNLSEGVYRGLSGEGLVYVNKSFVSLFGYQEIDEVLAEPIKNLYALDSQNATIQHKMKSHGHLKNEIIKFRKKDGSNFWGLVNCSFSVTNGRDKYFDGAIVDITKQKEFEELLQNKNLELKKINAQMDRFLYSASHDIRSPMTSIMGLVNILRMEIDAEKHNYLDKIDSSLRKLDYFIREVMQFSENARTRLASDKINFELLFKKAWDKVNGPYSAVRLNLNLPTNSYYFYTDGERLCIIIANILLNSIQYHSDDKEPKIDIRVDINTDRALIIISDNGKGIEKTHLSKAFDMFYRASLNSTGSGMGLFIARETVNKLKGHIRITSTPNLGTNIAIIIPNDIKGKLISKKHTLKRNRNA